MPSKKIKGLTPKQHKLTDIVVGQIVENGKTNLRKAGLEVFDTNNPESAAVMASRELSKANVKEGLEQKLESQGITVSKLASKLNEIAEIPLEDIKNLTLDAKIKASVELLKLLNAYPKNNTTHTRIDFKAKVNNLDFKDLSSSLNQLRSKNDSLITDSN